MEKNELNKLVISAKNRDKIAVEGLYKEYRSRLYFFVLKNVGNKDAAEDITEDAFLSSMQNISSLKNADSYETWLHSIAYNKCRQYFRQEKQSDHISLDDEAAGFQYHADDKIMLPEDYAESKELKRHLKKVIGDLKPDMRSAVILYYYDGMSIKQTAEILGISENSVKQKLHKARGKIKKEIEGIFAGRALCAVPISAMMRGTVSPKYAAAAKASGSALIGNSALALKLVGVAAAGTLAVGVPFALSSAKGSNFGLYNNDDSQFMTESVAIEEIEESEKDEGGFEMSESVVQTDASSLPFVENDSGENDDHKSDVSEGETTASQSDTSDSAVLPSSKSDNSDNSDKPEKAPISGNGMFAMTVGEILELAGDDYEMILPTGVQDGNKAMYKCARFPQYCFSGNIFDPINDGVSETDRKISFVNLYSGAYVNDSIYVGMTYNELCEALGGDIKISLSNTDIQFTSSVKIDGHKWAIAFDLTEAQRDEIYSRIKAQAPDEETFGLNPYKYSVSIADIDPTSYVAIRGADWDNQPVVTGGTFFALTVEQALEMGENIYTRVDRKYTREQRPQLYKCDAFPNYMFGKNYDSDQFISVVFLEGDAKISFDVSVGMTYNELAQKLGTKPEFQKLDTDYGALAQIDGITWEIYFDLTDEQREEIEKRFRDVSEDGENIPQGVSIDVSDMELVSTAAVYTTERQAYNY